MFSIWFFIVIILIIITSVTVILIRIEDRKEKNRLEEGDLTADDFVILE